MRLNDCADAFAGHEFPTTRTALVAEFGDDHLQLPEGTESVRAVLDRAGQEEFGSVGELRNALFCGVCAEAVGRRYYSDRDAPALGEDGPTQVSF
jgi:hypothetical protein